MEKDEDDHGSKDEGLSESCIPSLGMIGDEAKALGKKEDVISLSETTSFVKEDESRKGSAQQEDEILVPVSYKNKLLSVNSVDNNNDSSSEIDVWELDEDYDEEMQEDDKEPLDPLCPHIHVSLEERNSICRLWKKAIIIKL